MCSVMLVGLGGRLAYPLMGLIVVDGASCHYLINMPV